MTTTVRSVSDIPSLSPATNYETRAGTSTSTVMSPKRLARIAVVLYLLVGIMAALPKALWNAGKWQVNARAICAQFDCNPSRLVRCYGSGAAAQQ